MLRDAITLPTIACERLHLRWLTPDDVPALFTVFGDPEVCRYWSSPAMPALEDAAALRDQIVSLFAQRALFQWGVALRETDEVIGTCTLAGLDNAHRRASVGYALARAHWGRGYAGEVLARLVRFAFDDLDLHRLEADADPRNLASLRALERVGFVREGYQRERYHHMGEIQDTVLFGLLRREWRESRPDLQHPSGG
ncbi:MAG TPA: GNAT family N-acetyltransferase [Longimicrobium sp.]|jgi:RimJ/RimL family protein N-acetyltransferase|uniref:GNAT family N-acetyltransferase n=1 Tax=Longimicrobium sp. TaxID=2029185 RepID=UPI002ED86C4E